MKKKVFYFALAISASVSAGTYYVRPAGDATSWNSMPGIASDQIITSNAPVIDSVSIYYFAKGTYVLSATKLDPVLNLPTFVSPGLKTGKIYGGFSGSETAIDLAARITEDKDGNGIVEPWEFKNETVFRGPVAYDDNTGSTFRLITVTGGEVNGVTFYNHYFFGDLTVTPATPQSGAILLGRVTSYPQLADDMDEYAGKLTLCTVRKVKVGGAGPIMLTNKNSQVNQCLIEECTAMGGVQNTGGGAIWMNALGGKVSNSVIRNCESKFTATGTGKAGAIWAQHPSYDLRSNAPDCSTLIYNCLIHNNSASAYGAAVRVEGKNGGKTKAASVINCTILNNYTSTTFTTGTLEMIYDGCLAVNNIVLNSEGCADQRVQATRHLVSNSITGVLIGQNSYSPGNDMVSGKTIKDLKFVKPIYYVGAVRSDEGLENYQALYDSIRTANFRISSAESPAVTTPGALTLPATFPSSVALADLTPIPVIGSIPTTDMLGVSRAITNTLGAYQYVNTTGLNPSRFNKALSVVSLPNAVLINNEEGKEVSFFTSSGQLVHKQILKSNVEVVTLNNGFYVVTVADKVAKVIIK